MSYKILILMIFIISNHLYGFEKDLKIESENLPTEFTLLFESMKIELKSRPEQLEFVGLLQEMNDNLGFLKKDHLFFLMKSEIIKNVLEYKFDKSRQYDLTLSLVQRMEDKFQANERYYNSFSKWVFRSIIAELKYRQKMGLILEKSFNLNLFQGEIRSKALSFSRVIKYIMPWIDKCLDYTPTEFNKLSSNLSWQILYRLNDRSFLFKRFANSSLTETKIRLFNIPQKLLDLHPEEIKKIQVEAEDERLETQAKREKNEAQDLVEKADINDLSPISDDIIKSIENKSN